VSTPEEKILETEILVTHEADKSTYRFRIPGARDWVRLRAKVRELIRADDPASNGGTEGLDNISIFQYEAIAAFLTLYINGDNTWVMAPNDGGKPVVNPEKWPTNAPFVDVYARFTEQLGPFLGSGG
jgi:hypothetical protein